MNAPNPNNPEGGAPQGKPVASKAAARPRAVFSSDAEIDAYVRKYITKALKADDLRDLLLWEGADAERFYRVEDTTGNRYGLNGRLLNAAVEHENIHTTGVPNSSGLSAFSPLENADCIAFGGLLQTGEKGALYVGQEALLLFDKWRQKISSNCGYQPSEFTLPAGLLVWTPRLFEEEGNVVVDAQSVDDGEDDGEHAISRKFCSKLVDSIHRRFREVYTWNNNKNFVSEEAKAAAKQIFDNRFLNKNGGLKPVSGEGAVKPSCFFTHSMGARLSFMVENKLVELIREHGGNPKDYLEQWRRLSIGSAPDIEDMPQDASFIPTLHIVSEEDRAIAFRKSFADAHLQASQSGTKCKLSDLNNTQRVLVLGEEVLQATTARSSTDKNKHGLPQYVDAIIKYVDPDVLRDYLPASVTQLAVQQPTPAVGAPAVNPNDPGKSEGVA